MNEMSHPAIHEPLPDALEIFAARCAHDFNNLLTGILGNLELMQNRARRAGITAFDNYIEGARSAGGRAADFSQRLLIFSGHAGQNPTTVEVNALVLDLIELMRAQGLAVQCDLAADAGAVYCDAGQFELALLELLGNAREAVSRSGAVTLRTRAADGWSVIAVADTGCGMTSEILARAPEPFFSTRASGAGKGLGIPIAANFARQAGGTMLLQSTLAQGTTATLTLPAEARS